MPQSISDLPDALPVSSRFPIPHIIFILPPKIPPRTRFPAPTFRFALAHFIEIPFDVSWPAPSFMLRFFRLMLSGTVTRIRGVILEPLSWLKNLSSWIRFVFAIRRVPPASEHSMFSALIPRVSTVNLSPAATTIWAAPKFMSRFSTCSPSPNEKNSAPSAVAPEVFSFSPSARFSADTGTLANFSIIVRASSSGSPSSCVTFSSSPASSK